MSSLKQSGGSESDERCAMMDEKKRKRMIANRESARRSRMRKQKLMQDLTEEVANLQVANNTILGKIDGITEKYMICAGANDVLRAQIMELEDRLKYLNDFIKNNELRMSAAAAAAAAATEGPDHRMKLLQLPCSMQSIQASSGSFQL